MPIFIFLSPRSFSTCLATSRFSMYLKNLCIWPHLITGNMKTIMSRRMTEPTKWPVRPAKTQISLGICSVWSEPSLFAWRRFGSLATHKAHREDSDQIGWMPRLNWVFAGRTLFCWFCHAAAQMASLYYLDFLQASFYWDNVLLVWKKTLKYYYWGSSFRK